MLSKFRVSQFFGDIFYVLCGVQPARYRLRQWGTCFWRLTSWLTICGIIYFVYKTYIYIFYIKYMHIYYIPSFCINQIFIRQESNILII